MTLRRSGTGNGSIARAGLLIAFGAACVVSIGCARSPLRPDDERTPFDRYRRARNELPKPFIEDEYGRRTPNLRERLLQADDQ